jgi:hypothetical protein
MTTLSKLYYNMIKRSLKRVVYKDKKQEKGQRQDRRLKLSCVI